MAENASSAIHGSWYFYSGIPRGVVLLTHGLNGKPAAHDAMAHAFTQRGFAVFRPSFAGHRGDNQELLQIRAAQWEKDARDFHAEARAKAEALGVPLHHVGYSMSCLIYQALRDELAFSRRVYLAPALAFHRWYAPAAFLARTLPWITFRSRIPEGYNANPRSGVRTVVALDDVRRRFAQKHASASDSVPTLIWVDPRDELVNGAGLKALAARSPQWEYRELRTDGCTLPVKYHHLCIDEASVGSEEWRRVTDETVDFLGR